MDTIQTSALIDGVWTTQAVDLDTVLKRQKYEDEGKTLERDVRPSMGILTHTVIEDPVTHWIFPIRLLRDGDQDVVFIKDHSLEIRRVLQDGKMKVLVRETDLGSRIRNAMLLDFTDAATPPNEHNNITKDTTMTEAPELPPTWDRKAEPKSAWKSPREWSGHNVQPSKLSPQCIALALESGDLLFIHPYQIGSHVHLAVSRQQTTKPLLTEQLGRYMTVEPRSRYLATGNSEGHLAVFELDSQVILRKGSSLASTPVKSIRHFILEGTILKVDFLYPSRTMPQHMILLLLIANKGHTRMQLFEWDTTDKLMNTKSTFQYGHLLPPRYRLPLLLIPLKFASAFMLVCTDVIVICQDLLLHSPRYMESPMIDDQPSKDYTGCYRPLWTAFAKPMQGGTRGLTHEDFFLAREDGIVKKIEIEDGEDLFPIEMFGATFCCNIGTAFASLGRHDNSSGYTLIAGDDCGNGAIYELYARMDPILVTTISGCSQVLDFTSKAPFASTDDHSGNTTSLGKEPHFYQPQQIFACCGQTSSKSLVELRYGYEARLLVEVALPFVTPVIGSWALDIASFSVPHLLLSHGDGLTLLQPSIDQQSLTVIPQFGTWLKLSDRTLLVSSYNGRTVQITEQEVLVSQDSVRTTAISADVHRYTGSESSKFILATTYKTHIVIACTESDSTSLKLLQVLPDNVSLRAEDRAVFQVFGVPLTRLPTSLCMAVVEERLTILVGYGAPVENCLFQESQRHNSVFPLVSLYSMDLASGELSHHEDIIDSRGFSHGNACTSLAILSRKRSSGNWAYLVLSGFRNGTLIASTLDPFVGERKTQQLTETSLGITQVNISCDEGNPSLAIILCDSQVFLVFFNPDVPFLWTLRHIWLTETGNPYLHQPALQQICNFAHKRILMITSEQILVGEVDTNAKALPRTLHHTGTFRRIASIDAVNETNGLVLATQRMQPFLIDCDEQAMPQPETSTNRERLITVQAWEYKEVHRQDAKQLFVCGYSQGLLEVFGWNSNFYHSMHMGAAVTVLYGHGADLFCGAGETLIWMSLNMDPVAGFHILLEYDLPSPAASITFLESDPALANSGYLHVLTTKHSLLSFFISGGDTETARILPINADEIARDGLDHISVDASAAIWPTTLPLSIISDRTCSLIGLQHERFSAENPPKYGSDLLTLFEAELPFSITRFNLVERRRHYESSTRGEVDWGHDAVLLGMGINGSMVAIKGLTEQTWRLLAFIQKTARRSSVICPFTWDIASTPLPEYNPRSRHIDGNLLKKCAGKIHSLFPASDKQLGTLCRAVFSEWTGYSHDPIEELLGRLLDPVL